MLLTASRGASTVDNLANAGRNFRELYGANMAIRGRDFFFNWLADNVTGKSQNMISAINTIKRDRYVCKIGASIRGNS